MSNNVRYPVNKAVFTTGQVAKICHVAPRTVSKWFDSGRLRGYRIPGSQDRRIPRENLVRFLVMHDIPLHRIELTDDEIVQHSIPAEKLTPASFQDGDSVK